MEYFPLYCEKPVGSEAIDRYGVQIINADLIAGKEHIEFAIAQAERAFKNSTNFSNSLPLEVIVRASAQRQVKVAIDRLGVRGDSRVIVLDKLPAEFMEEYRCTVSEEVLNITPEKLQKLIKIYGISQEEMEASHTGDAGETVKNLIIERIALLNVI